MSKSLTEIRDENKEEFKKLCHVNKFGECKYWNPEQFGYAKTDTESPCDKFFPEKVYEKLSSAETRLLQGVVEKIEKLRGQDAPHEDTHAQWDCGYYAGLSDLKAFIKEGLDDVDDISLCPHCHCMTKTVSSGIPFDGTNSVFTKMCGKCGDIKEK